MGHMRSPRDKFLRSSFFCVLSIALILGIETVMGVSAAFSHYQGDCTSFQGETYPCSFDEKVMDEMILWYFLGWFLLPIPCFFWGISTGRAIALSLKLSRMFSGLLMLASAIAGGMIGYWIGRHWIEILLPVIRMMDISPKHS